MSEIEKKTFEVNGTEVRFIFSEFPNDLKTLAFLAGELSVSATYFSTFGNVNTSNCHVISGTFGPGPTHTRQSWEYNQRVAISKEVEKLKLKLEKQKGSKVTKRNKITSFMLQSTHKMANLTQNEICAVLCSKRQYKQHDGEKMAM